MKIGATGATGVTGGCIEGVALGSRLVDGTIDGPSTGELVRGDAPSAEGARVSV